MKARIRRKSAWKPAPAVSGAADRPTGGDEEAARRIRQLGVNYVIGSAGQIPEVFIDEGENNMFAVMKELVKQKYTRLIDPEYPRGLNYDRAQPSFRSQYPGGGGYAAYAFNVGYARAMMQAALSA